MASGERDSMCVAEAERKRVGMASLARFVLLRGGNLWGRPDSGPVVMTGLECPGLMCKRLGVEVV